MAKDSVGFDDAGGSGGLANQPGWWQGVLLFLVALIALSDFFVNNVVNVFPGAVSGREPTDLGALVQSICIVLLYMTATWLCDEGIL